MPCYGGGTEPARPSSLRTHAGTSLAAATPAWIWTGLCGASDIWEPLTREGPGGRDPSFSRHGLLTLQTPAGDCVSLNEGRDPLSMARHLLMASQELTFSLGFPLRYRLSRRPSLFPPPAPRFASSSTCYPPVYFLSVPGKQGPCLSLSAVFSAPSKAHSRLQK